jgi:hypothetical protein
VIGDRITVRAWKDKHGWSADWDLYRLWVLPRYNAALGAPTEQEVLLMALDFTNRATNGTLIPLYEKGISWVWKNIYYKFVGILRKRKLTKGELCRKREK